MYSSIVWNPASSLAVADEVYHHLMSVLRHRSRPVIYSATWSWNPPRALPMRGVTNMVSDPKINTACTTALKKNLDTRGYAPYLLSILVILFHTALDHETFPTTAIQSSFAAEITHPRYRKEVTIYRARP